MKLNKDYIVKEVKEFKILWSLLLRGKGSLADYLLLGSYISMGYIIGSVL